MALKVKACQPALLQVGAGRLPSCVRPRGRWLPTQPDPGYWFGCMPVPLLTPAHAAAQPLLHAGIAVGAASVAVGAVAAAWVLLRRRQARAAPAASVASEAAAAADKVDVEGRDLSPGWPPGGPHASGPYSTSSSSLLSTTAQLPAVLAEAGLAAQLSSNPSSWHSSQRSRASTGMGRSAVQPAPVLSTGQLLSGRPIAASPFAARPAAVYSTGQLVSGRTVAASPFAARQREVSPGSTASPSGGAAAPWQPPPPGAVLSELVAQRALEDAAPTIDGLTVGGTPAPTSGSLSGSAASAGTTSLGSGGGLGAAPLGADGLPVSLKDWLIPASDIHVLRRPGRPEEKWVLGDGARCGSPSAPFGFLCVGCIGCIAAACTGEKSASRVAGPDTSRRSKKCLFQNLFAAPRAAAASSTRRRTEGTRLRSRKSTWGAAWACGRPSFKVCCSMRWDW